MSAVSHKVRRVLTLLRQNPIKTLMIIFRVLFLKFQHGLVYFAHRNGFLASLYFTFFSQRFYREHKGVLQGSFTYRRANIRLQKTSSHLRRNTHRLEKGLIMRPLRPSFAEDYIVETVQLFQQAKEGGSLCSDELKWAHNVLSLYFETVTDTPTIATARNIFQNIKAQAQETISFIPYQQQKVPKLEVSYDQLLNLFKRRRSVRWYQQDKIVEKALIVKAIEAASLAPSACNRQPFSFHVLSQKEQAIKVAKMAGGTGGFAENIPCLIVVVGNLSCYIEERDRHLIYIDGALASMQLMLALESLGLSSCPINWPDIESKEQEIQHELGLQNYERPIMQISVGYADPKGQIPYSQKKKASLLIH